MPVRLRGTAFVLFSCLMGMGGCLTSNAAPEPKNVLAVFPFDSHVTVQESTDQIFRRAMLADSRPLQFFTEYLDLIRFPSKFHQEKLADYLRVRYVGQRIDLVVCLSFPALQFWLDYGLRLFPRTPVLFMGVEKRRLRTIQLPASITGLTFTFDDTLLLDTILRLHPQTRSVFLVGGTTEFERFWMTQRICNLKARHSELLFEDLSNLPETSLISKLQHLPTASVVLFQDLYRTASGRNLQGDDGIRLVCRANAPVYGFYADFVGKGLTGASVVDVNTGVGVAAMGWRLLSGENPATVGIVNSASHQFLFDWRQLKRWGIRESQLPLGSTVMFKQPSFWSLYKWRIILLIAFCLAETALMLGLLAQWARRRRADLAIRQLNGQLINAQEEERARIARELHDDIGQQIAAVGLGLNLLEAKIAEAPAQALEQIPRVEERINTLAGSIRHLSHELHPAILEYAGLPAALRTHCDEFGELTGISVNLGFQPNPLNLPRDVSLCLYRISQECLRNTSKHSGAHYVRLQVKASRSAVELIITDDGCGFNVEAARHGLGLKSMNERVRLLNGTLYVNSRPNWGTVLKARIPLAKQFVAS